MDLTAPLAVPGRHQHDPDLVADALAHHFGFVVRDALSVAQPSRPEVVRTFEQSVARARRRLAELEAKEG